MSFHLQLVLRPAPGQFQPVFAEVEHDLENLAIDSDDPLQDEIEKELGCTTEDATSEQLSSLANDYCWGIFGSKEKSFDKAKFCLQAAVDKGSIEAQYSMGLLHKSGVYINDHCVGQSDQLAFLWVKRAVDSGLTPANTRLAEFYKDGTGTEQSYEKAAACYERAGNDSCRALCELAEMYESGHGVERSSKKAAELYLAAAMKKDERAAFQLAKLYFVGQGVERSPEQAEYWYNKALVFKQASDDLYG